MSEISSHFPAHSLRMAPQRFLLIHTSRNIWWGEGRFTLCYWIEFPHLARRNGGLLLWLLVTVTKHRTEIREGRFILTHFFRGLALHSYGQQESAAEDSACTSEGQEAQERKSSELAVPTDSLPRNIIPPGPSLRFPQFPPNSTTPTQSHVFRCAHNEATLTSKFVSITKKCKHSELIFKKDFHMNNR